MSKLIILFFITLFGLSLYSYALVDPNLTLVSHPLWAQFREYAVYLGYYERTLSFRIYLSLVILLFGLYFLITRRKTKVDPLIVGLFVGCIVFFSYPFLSHDFFNYIFDAKILTHYGQNPYTHIPGNFPADPWLRFMHWTGRSYPYGPVFLLLTLIPSLISFGVFILNYVFFKILWIGFYLLGIYALKKHYQREALIFAIHPFIIIEGLINLHNDLIGVVLALIGCIFVIKYSKKAMGTIMFIASFAIKFITVPFLLLGFRLTKKTALGVLVLQIIVIVYLSYTRSLQPWYFLTFFAFLPIFPSIIKSMDIFLFGLLMSYYPFIALGDWNSERLAIRSGIIFTGVAINLIFLAVTNYPKLKKYLPALKSS